MNPLPTDDEESEARLIGRAYHRRICEAARPSASYQAALDPTQHPAALRTNEELCAAIGRAGGSVKRAARRARRS